MYTKASQIFPEKQGKRICLKLGFFGSPVVPLVSKNSTLWSQGTMLIFLRADGVHLEIGRKGQVSTSRRLFHLCCSDISFLWRWKVFLIYQNYIKPVYLWVTLSHFECSDIGYVSSRLESHFKISSLESLIFNTGCILSG